MYKVVPQFVRFCTFVFTTRRLLWFIGILYMAARQCQAVGSRKRLKVAFWRGPASWRIHVWHHFQTPWNCEK